MRKSLLGLLQDLKAIEVIKGPCDTCKITGVCLDSRMVEPGMVFFALSGSRLEGMDFIRQAVDRGASAVLVPSEFVERIQKDIPDDVVLLCSDRPATVLGLLASAFWGHPSRRLDVIGITGTNGKTTCSFLLEKILLAAGASCGMSGTIFQRTPRDSCPANLTTPDAASFQAFLAKLVDQGAEYAISEVSSHGLIQGRVEGCRFRLAIFTNLSHDHLDYHGDMESYFQAKRLLFTAYAPEDAVINLDDQWGQRLWNQCNGRKISYGLTSKAMVRPIDYQIHTSGIEAVVSIRGQQLRIMSHLIGRHNLYNILAATAAATALGIEPEYIQKGLYDLEIVPGRLERVSSPPGITALVDYAHTPDALKNVLQCLKDLGPARLITVIGCGGDRDRSKRPEMAEIAVSMSDLCVLTSDNPRTESPEAIIQDMLAGVPPGYLDRLKVVTDRRSGISWAASKARPGDVILVAGKGHEDYQIIGSEKIPFDDRRVLEESFDSGKLASSIKRDGKNLLCLNDIRAVVSGNLLQGGDVAFSSICTDSRTICPGQLFWALRGENFDGHSFVKAAVDKGAVCAVVEYLPEGLPTDFPILQVDDSLKGLGAFARWYKRRLGFKVFAITGSCGKTTTKELLISILKTTFNATGTKGNFNNLIGLPLTMLGVSPGTQWVVLEMGTNMPGEIERLCQIAEPDAGLVTCIRPVHLEGLGSVENIAREKIVLLKDIPAEGTVGLNLDEALICNFSKELICRNIVGFTCKRRCETDIPISQCVTVKDICQTPKGLELEVSVGDKGIRISSPLSGKVNASNILAAVAGGVGLGIDLEEMAQAIQAVQAQKGRMKMERYGSWMILDDSYNANPSSVKAAIEAMDELEDMPAEKILILGDMLELGTEAETFHRDIGAFVAMRNPALFITVGPLARLMAEEALGSGLDQDRVFSFESTSLLLDWLTTNPSAFFRGDRRAVLVKGSRGVGLEDVVFFIRERLERET